MSLAQLGSGDAVQRLCLAADTRQEAALRLRTTRGHLDAIVRMLEADDPYCIDVLQQLKAVTRAVAKVTDSVLRAHLRDHVARPPSPKHADALAEELMTALRYHQG